MAFRVPPAGPASCRKKRYSCLQRNVIIALPLHQPLSAFMFFSFGGRAPLPGIACILGVIAIVVDVANMAPDSPFALPGTKFDMTVNPLSKFLPVLLVKPCRLSLATPPSSPGSS
jgi:hypothetical protein